jgi:branched-chain amino acid transport system ATP-binding protein
MLDIKGITVRYGAIEALTDISLSVEPGQFVAVLGANGAGKSTLLRTISGLLQPVSGSLRWMGAEIGAATPESIVRRGIAHVPEGRGIFSDMTVRENLEIGAYSRPDRAALKQDYDDIIATFPVLGRRESQRGSTLSGGEQQMLAIGRALMSRPTLLLADEVSLGLAPVMVRTVFEALAQLRHRGVTLIAVEQNARLALKFADYVFVLKHGRLAMQGTSAELSNSGGLVEAYLGV